MNLDTWGWERVASIGLVAAVAVTGCFAWCCCSLPYCLWRHTFGRLIGSMLPVWAWSILSIVFAACYGFVLALSARSVPCVWLSCDGGEDDDPRLRDLLLWVGWPTASLVFLVLFCCRGQVCGISRGQHKRLEA